MVSVPYITAVSPTIDDSAGGDHHATTEHLDVVVIGGSQAGLAMGYELAQQGRRFVILDAHARVGDAWRQRYDSLVLFTPSQYNNLPGMPFPMPRDTYPTKDQVADYLERYARTFDLPVRSGQRVLSVEMEHVTVSETAARPPRTLPFDGYRVHTTGGTFHADQVVVATGGFQRPYIPGFGRQLGRAVYQVHSSQYRNPQQLPPGDVLVVGAGNSGAQIAAELCRERQVYLSVGKRLASLPQRFLGRDIQWWLRAAGVMNASVESRLGRKLKERDSLIGADLGKLAAEQQLRLVGRAIDAGGGSVVTADGQTLAVSSVVWATGYRPDYGWIHLPVFDQRGSPVHTRGVTAAPGLYFLGLYWQHTRGSALLGGVGRDAAYLAERIAQRAPSVLP